MYPDMTKNSVVTGIMSVYSLLGNLQDEGSDFERMYSNFMLECSDVFLNAMCDKKSDFKGKIEFSVESEIPKQLN